MSFNFHKEFSILFKYANKRIDFYSRNFILLLLFIKKVLQSSARIILVFGRKVMIRPSVFRRHRYY